MRSIWSHTRIVADILSMKVFVWVLARLFTSAAEANGGILDSHLFFYARYSDLAEHHRARGRSAKAGKAAARAEAFYRAAPDDDDDDPREAAATAMPAPRPRVYTNAVSTFRLPSTRTRERSGMTPSPACPPGA